MIRRLIFAWGLWGLTGYDGKPTSLREALYIAGVFGRRLEGSDGG